MPGTRRSVERAAEGRPTLAAVLSFEPFRVDVPGEVLDDLRDRLRRTRFPNQVDGAGWDQGTDLSYLQELVAYWADEFDWRAAEARINAFPQVTTTVDGQRIHLVVVGAIGEASQLFQKGRVPLRPRQRHIPASICAATSRRAGMRTSRYS